MKFILSLDQGTTSSRAIIFNEKAEIVSVGQKEFRQIFPRPGWVEHDANEIWETQIASAREALQKANISWGEVSAVGIANQRETVVAWHRETGEPVANAIVWQDRRTTEYCNALKSDGKESWIQSKTGLLLDPYFSGTKIKWLLDENPEIMKLAEADLLAIGTIDSWLVWKLSDGASHVTDVSNASRTLLMNLQTCAWDRELLDLFGTGESLLPRIVDSSGDLAETSASVTEVSVPITGILGDQQAALFGQACFEPGMVKSTYGTGCFILMNVGETPAVSEHKLLSTVAWRVKGKAEYALEGSVFIGGALVQWLRDELNIIESASEVESLAAEVEDSGGVTIIPAFSGLGAPYWDPYARGAILGLTRGSSRAHIARAALEGIAYQVADVAQAMENDSGRRLESIQADGGASANGILMQTQADLLGARVRCSQIAETTALGAAFMAGLAVGYWKSRSELAGLWQERQRFNPMADAQDRKRKLARWRRNVARVRDYERPD